METLLAKYKTQLEQMKSQTLFTSDEAGSYHDGQVDQLESVIEDLEAAIDKGCALGEK